MDCLASALSIRYVVPHSRISPCHLCLQSRFLSLWLFYLLRFDFDFFRLCLFSSLTDIVYVRYCIEKASIPPDPSASNQHIMQVLESPVNTDDLTTIATVLSQWPTQPNPESFDAPFGPKLANIIHGQDLWPFTLVLYKAIEEDKAQLVSYVLGRGLKPQPLARLKALDTSSIDIFQALFEHGWDIDAPLAPKMSPPLWFVCPRPSILWPENHRFLQDAIAGP